MRISYAVFCLTKKQNISYDLFFLLLPLPPRSTRTVTLCPYTTLFRSLYMSELVETAVAEDVPELGIRPGMLCVYEIDMAGIIDLCDDAVGRRAASNRMNCIVPGSISLSSTDAAGQIGRANV